MSADQKSRIKDQVGAVMHAGINSVSKIAGAIKAVFIEPPGYDDPYRKDKKKKKPKKPQAKARP